MPQYTQLSWEERKRIFVLLQHGMSLRKVAFAMGRNPSTISRELKRNQYPSQHSYRPVDAQRMTAIRRRERPYVCKLRPTTIRWIKFKLKKQWSPEQISARLQMEHKISISHEWIYQWLLKDRQQGGLLFKNLRRSHRKNKKRYGISRKSKYPNAKSIETRPEIASNRERLGDWEGDTIVGPKGKSGIVSLVERVSCLARLQVTPKRHANSVRISVVNLLNETDGPKHTITFDRGLEFSKYERIEKDAKIEVYFAHPYCSYERGTNENLNGLIRQYFPKRTDFTNVSRQQIKRVEWLLNHRPRKKLGYLTPFEAYYGYCPYPKNSDKPDMRDWKKRSELALHQNEGHERFC